MKLSRHVNFGNLVKILKSVRIESVCWYTGTCRNKTIKSTRPTIWTTFNAVSHEIQSLIKFEHITYDASINTRVFTRALSCAFAALSGLHEQRNDACINASTRKRKYVLSLCLCLWIMLASPRGLYTYVWLIYIYAYACIVSVNQASIFAAANFRDTFLFAILKESRNSRSPGVAKIE